jgi:hypothetical protein
MLDMVKRSGWKLIHVLLEARHCQREGCHVAHTGWVGCKVQGLGACTRS